MLGDELARPWVASVAAHPQTRIGGERQKLGHGYPDGQKAANPGKIRAGTMRYNLRPRHGREGNQPAAAPQGGR